MNRTRFFELLDELIVEAGTNNEMDNRGPLARSREALVAEVERLIDTAKREGFTAARRLDNTR